MQMRIKQNGGRREWTFVLSNTELYQIVCHICASLTALEKPDLLQDKDWFQRGVVHTVYHAGDKTMEELDSAKEPFLRAIFTECKRLGINPWEEAKHEDA